MYRVVDTIGLHDTGLTAADVMARFSTFAEHTPQGIHVFLFVVRWGRFKPEHEAALSAFAANAGEAALRHTLLVFTHCSESSEDLQRIVHAKDAPASLREWASKAGGAVAVDNVLAAPDSRAALHIAIERLCAENEEPYSNDALAEARRRHDGRQEEERAAFAAAVADWRKGEGPVVIERECDGRGDEPVLASS
jgi:hypothetical protein